nr:S8 family serine peptidase [uncultured Actinomyces sp.]
MSRCVSSRVLASVRGRVARVVGVGVSCVALAVGALVASPAAVAADPITHQDYVDYYHLDSARAKGITGKGVIIALIDGPVELSDPELAGATIVDKSRCTIEAPMASRYHASGLAAVLVSQNYGVAPDATLYTYQVTNKDTVSTGTCGTGASRLNSFDKLINQAIDDGAQIISISQGSSSHDENLKWAIARAMSQGVIIVNSAGNNARDDNNSQMGWWSGVVGVSAIGTDGKFTSYSSWGNGVTTAAVGGPIKARDFDTGADATTIGTSNSAALVSGFLALARAKWPNATPNQLLQLLVNTTQNPDGKWDKYTGYGAIDPGKMANTDPSQYPDENPLAQKEGGSSPTVEEVRNYSDGLISPFTATLPTSYVYRGLDEIALSSTHNAHLGTSPRYHTK